MHQFSNNDANSVLSSAHPSSKPLAAAKNRAFICTLLRLSLHYFPREIQPTGSVLSEKGNCARAVLPCCSSEAVFRQESFPRAENREGMDGSVRSAAANQKKPFLADNDLVELLWHNGSVVAQPQAHPRAPPSDCPSSSGLTGDETAAWFPDAFDDALEKELYTQLWYGSVADAATPHHWGTLPGPSSQAPPELARPPKGSGGGGGVERDVCSTFCGSNQAFSSAPVGKREDGAEFLPEAPRVAGTGTGTSSSGGSGSTFGVSGLPGGSGHAHKRKGGVERRLR